MSLTEIVNYSFVRRDRGARDVPGSPRARGREEKDRDDVGRERASERDRERESEGMKKMKRDARIQWTCVGRGCHMLKASLVGQRDEIFCMKT